MQLKSKILIYDDATKMYPVQDNPKNRNGAWESNCRLTMLLFFANPS